MKEEDLQSLENRKIKMIQAMILRT